MTRKINVSALAPVIGTLYPPPYHEPCLSRERSRIGDAAGLTQFGVNLLRLPSGAWSSQRHWHTEADELVYVLAGEVTLVTDEGPELLRAGEAAGFKGADANGHCLRNLSDSDALVLEIGSRIIPTWICSRPRREAPYTSTRTGRRMRTCKGGRRRGEPKRAFLIFFCPCV